MERWNDVGETDPARAWRALRPGTVEVGGEVHEVRVVEGGTLSVASGRLLAVDPFTSLWRVAPWYAIRPGRYPVRVTWDATLGRAMYVSLVLREEPDVRREPLIPNDERGEPYPDRGADNPYGVAVDAGTVCLVDAEALRRAMPSDKLAWRAVIMGEDPPGRSWFDQVEDGGPLPRGMAHIPLPGAWDGERHGASIFLCSSGWGDGYYPALGGYDATNRFVAVHIDLLLLSSICG